ncbi:uncharacterized protein YbjT (DUF2867 family) [Actinoalloteichus hoggarensis]|uniref:NAD(P)H azoreductase n=1 Tax=Actinoalloteichus hoggarensis TaxID=1470176 RepID=A0A221W520_9PSEU|nr:NAD(P)H-binding protein [Actinoalloteichus hoggarensis]ASO20823.1 NAD(P)H azoreductase [Actinoalloteichus hoggarensis]MBB5920754.1 uncharacterized protein YbjT (DUF2867 family) [Actinoalloteichus hoggarensis]
MRIVVTGATGVVGRRVVAKLVAAGVDVRALTRRPETAALPAEVEVVAGDLEVPATLSETFVGADRVYLFPAAEAADEVVERIRLAGARRIVVLSGTTADDPEEEGGADYRRVEQAVERSGLEWTHVRPGMFAGNVLDWAESIRAEGVVRLVYGEIAQAPVHEDDIAEVAVAALLTDDHVGARYPLSGPESLTRFEQVRAVGRAIGRELTVEELTPDEWRASMAAEDMPEEVTEWLLELWRKRIGSPDPVLPTVEQVTGRPARTLEQWVSEHVEAFR